MTDTPEQRAEDLVAFGASDAACYHYPGENQHPERAAFIRGSVVGHAAIASSERIIAEQAARIVELEHERSNAVSNCMEAIEWLVELGVPARCFTEGKTT